MIDLKEGLQWPCSWQRQENMFFCMLLLWILLHSTDPKRDCFNVQQSYGASLQGRLSLSMNRHWSTRVSNRIVQCFFFGQTIGQVAPQNIYFHYLKIYVLDQSIQKTVY